MAETSLGRYECRRNKQSCYSIAKRTTAAQVGLAAAVILFVLRLIQSLCLGGEYGGAITYVAEHIVAEKRGYYTGWLQTLPTLGIVISLAMIIGTRTFLGNAAFTEWG